MFSLEVTMVKVVILNDTTRDEGHIGCRLVMENMRKLCRENGWNVLFCDQNGRNGFSKKEVPVLSPGRIGQSIFIPNAFLGRNAREKLPVFSVARAKAKR